MARADDGTTGHDAVAYVAEASGRLHWARVRAYTQVFPSKEQRVAAGVLHETSDEWLGAGVTQESSASSSTERTAILLVEASPEGLLALGEALATPELELIGAACGAEALEAFGGRGFALVLIDLEAQRATGLDTALQMQRLGLREDRDVPIVFVMASEATPTQLRDAYARGAIDVVQRPLDVDAVRSKVRAFAELFRSKERLRKRLEAAVRAREEQVAIVAHDLRNPLSTVLLAASQIEKVSARSPSGERTGKAARSIVRAVGRMTRLVGDLLDVAKLEAGQTLPLELAHRDVGKLVRAAVESNDALARARFLTLTLDAEAGVVLECDAERIDQVLTNLIDNAIKFTREGGAIHVRSRRTDDGALVSVSDTGTGITDSELRRIFEPYCQLDARAKVGAGLGLAIARGVVTAHGGRIWADSELGVGATFYFTLPWRTPTLAAEDGR